MFVPYILGSDKTTVSVATGQTEYYPLYGSLGTVFNNVRRAHRNAISLLAFLAIPKSKFFNIYNILPSSNFVSSRPALSKWSCLPSIPTPVIPRFSQCDTSIPSWRYDYSGGCYVSRRSLSASYIWSRTIYSWLSWTSTSFVYSSRMVCTVSVNSYMTLKYWFWYCCTLRCTALQTDLDGGGVRRSHEHTDQLLQVFDLKTLWDDYGIVGDLIVSRLPYVIKFFLTISTVHSAIHHGVPTCRYPRVTLSWSSPSNHKRNVQRPFGSVGWRVFSLGARKGPSSGDYGRYWPPVCCFLVSTPTLSPF